jgi:hypothetical protein
MIALAAVSALGAGCASAGDEPDIVPGRVPLVDPASGRIEEIPDTERRVPVQLAPVLTGERQRAAERLSAVAVRLGTRDDATAGPVPFDRLSEAELRQWFADRYILTGDTAEAGYSRTLAAAASEVELVGRERPALAPTVVQAEAILELHRNALGSLELTWNASGGAPRQIDGPLFLEKGVDTATVASDFIRRQWPLLRRLVEADDDDVLEPVTQGRGDEDRLQSIVFRRVRRGMQMPQNALEVFVSTPSHPLGAGLITRVSFEWDRLALAPGASLLTREDALLLASDELGVDLLADGAADTLLDLRCIDQPDGRRRCGPTWFVSSHVTPRAESVDAAPGTGADSIDLDATTGEVLWKGNSKRNYTGSVNVTSNWAYDTTDSYRDYQYARLLAYPGPDYAQLPNDGSYSWTPPGGGTSAYVGLDSTIAPVLRHIAAYDTSCSYALQPHYAYFGLGGTANVFVAPNTTDTRRGDFLTWNWFQYMFDVMTYDFGGYAESPSTLMYDIAPSSYAGGGQFMPCNGTTGFGALGVGGGNDAVSTSGAVRETALHEWSHSVAWCTQTVGAGCGWVAGPPDAINSAWAESESLKGVWFNGFSGNGSAGGVSRYRRYWGENVVGDLIIHEEEIDGTPVTDGSCQPPSYECNNSLEACYMSAHNHPRCMFRGDDAACRARFPNQPGIGSQPVGIDASGTPGIAVCAANGYTNAMLWFQLATQLLFTDGYYGLRPFFGVDRFFSYARKFTQTTNNYHTEFWKYARDYEVTDAFHSVSTESFPWFDDTTDERTHAEIIRMPRTSQLVFANGGPTGTALSLSTPTSHDTDYFLLPTNQSNAYEVQTTTSSTSVDLCIQIYNWVTGALVATAPGCTDGSATPAVRNATIAFSTGTVEKFAVRVSNVLLLSGNYDLRVRNLSDDYPDALTAAFGAQPVGPNSSTSGVLNWPTDADLFRYDRPLGATGAITFTALGPTPLPTVKLWFTTSTTQPSGSPFATGTGTVTVTTPSVGHYYAQVVNAGAPSGTGYSLVTTVTSGTANESGTFASPRPLPTAAGGFVWNRIDAASLSVEFPDWTACRTGAQCDWYDVTLAANERLTVTLYNVFDADCDLEVAVYGPAHDGWTLPASDMAYFAGGAWDGASWDWYPAVLDREGSMENNGSQLTFVARVAGQHRIRVRGTGALNCPRYEMGVAHGAIDTELPPAVH